MNFDDGKFDKIYIRDLTLKCIIGIFERERKIKQKVIINIAIFADLKKACKTDNINETVDYKLIKKNIILMVKKSNYFLIEKLADEIAGICLENKKVESVMVTVDKPGALRFARSVAIQIVRNRENNEKDS